jgi:hypothetical protein
MSANPSMFYLHSHPSDEEVAMVYQQICTGYQNIEDFRSKLLALVPFVTASSFVATIFSNPTKSSMLTNLVLPFGALGALITLGLYIYELENTHRLALLAARGQRIERHMNIVGVFNHPSSPLLNDYTAADLIYLVTIAGWVCLALWFALPGLAIFVALALIVVSILLGLPALRRLRRQIARNVLERSENVESQLQGATQV